MKLVWILALSGAAAMSAENRGLPDQVGRQWRPYLEWRLDNPSVDGNPFDVEAKAVFLHESSGTTLTTHLFYDGETSWAFRFTPTLAGVWRFETFSSDDDLAGWSGRARIETNPDPNAHGFMKAFGNKWGWQGSEQAFVPQYVMIGDPSRFLTEDGEVDEAAIDSTVREFVIEHGFTGFHITGDGRWFDGDDPNVNVYRALETMVLRVHAAGGACHIWQWGSGASADHGRGPAQLAGGASSEKNLRNLRYLADRLGPVPGWSMGYGFDTENGWAPRRELNAWKDFLEARMGWDHFLGARVGFDEKGLFGRRPRPPRPPHDAGFRSPIDDIYTTWLGGDYIGYTSYRPLYPRYREAIQHHPDKPSFEEDRFRLRDSAQWEYKDYNEELTRRGLWHSALAGGVANIWGNLLPEAAPSGGSQPYPIKRQIKTYSRFFEGRFLKTMMSEYVGPELVLRTPDRNHLIIYRENADQVRIDLRQAKKTLPAVAVDAKRAYKEIDIGSFEPGAEVWKAPYRSDWAIAVGSF